MSIDEMLDCFMRLKHAIEEGVDSAIETMRKYQKIEKKMERLVDYDKFIMEYGVLSNHEDDYRLLCAAKITAYTKDEVIAMFTELQLDIEKHTMTSGVTNQGTWNECIACCSRVVQQKIDSLKENTDGSN